MAVSLEAQLEAFGIVGGEFGLWSGAVNALSVCYDPTHMEPDPASLLRYNKSCGMGYSNLGYYGILMSWIVLV